MRPAQQLFVALPAALLAPGAAGLSAMIQVFHNDLDGIIDPGQTVRIDYYLTWDTFPYLASMQGDAVATPNRGVARNPVIGFNQGHVGPTTNPGTPDGGSIRGFVALHHPVTGFVVPGFTWTPLGITALSYEWTAPGPEHAGEYDFTFEFDSQWPSIYLYPGVQTGFEAVPTTVVPMTLTVIPGPWSSAFLAGGAVSLIRRRRV